MGAAVGLARCWLGTTATSVWATVHRIVHRSLTQGDHPKVGWRPPNHYGWPRAPLARRKNAVHAGLRAHNTACLTASPPRSGPLHPPWTNFSVRVWSRGAILACSRAPAPHISRPHPSTHQAEKIRPFTAATPWWPRPFGPTERCHGRVCAAARILSPLTNARARESRCQVVWPVDVEAEGT